MPQATRQTTWSSFYWCEWRGHSRLMSSSQQGRSTDLRLVTSIGNAACCLQLPWIVVLARETDPHHLFVQDQVNLQVRVCMFETEPVNWSQARLSTRAGSTKSRPSMWPSAALACFTWSKRHRFLRENRHRHRLVRFKLEASEFANSNCQGY